MGNLHNRNYPVAMGKLQEVELLVDLPCEIAECPTWHPEERRLYWTDIPAGRMYFWDAVSRRHELCYEDRPVGGMTLQRNGELLLFRDKGNVVAFRAGKILRTVIASIPELERTRFNDVIADPCGRVFAGSLSFDQQTNGRLYRIDCDASYTVVSEGHATPNGMGFSPHCDVLYFTDSRRRVIYRFCYDKCSGALGQQEVFHCVSDEQLPLLGRSDGMTVDAEGNIWSARYEGGQVLKISPRGEVLESWPIPVRNVTSLTFGGDNYTELFVTTAGGPHRDAQQPLAGALFRLRPGVRGRAEFRSAVGL